MEIYLKVFFFFISRYKLNHLILEFENLEQNLRLCFSYNHLVSYFKIKSKHSYHQIKKKKNLNWAKQSIFVFKKDIQINIK